MRAPAGRRRGGGTRGGRAALGRAPGRGGGRAGARGGEAAVVHVIADPAAPVRVADQAAVVLVLHAGPAGLLVEHRVRLREELGGRVEAVVRDAIGDDELVVVLEALVPPA